ncbi:MAG: hypothetical protein EB084_06270 [Proteobacteria bacterium]|nr:hypothetical protein [Pseudomonadota bacterium]
MGLLFVIVVMMAYMIFVQPVRSPGTTAPRTVAGEPGTVVPGTPQPPDPVAPPGAGASGQAAQSDPKAPQGAPGQASSGGKAGGQMPAGPVPGRMGALHLREYLSGIVALEGAGKLKLSRAQAAALLPLMRQLGSLSSAVPTSRDLIIAALTPDQKAYLEKNIHTGPPSPDPQHTAEELLQDSIRRLLDAVGSR